MVQMIQSMSVMDDYKFGAVLVLIVVVVKFFCKYQHLNTFLLRFVNRVFI